MLYTPPHTPVPVTFSHYCTNNITQNHPPTSHDDSAPRSMSLGHSTPAAARVFGRRFRSLGARCRSPGDGHPSRRRGVRRSRSRSLSVRSLVRPPANCLHLRSRAAHMPQQARQRAPRWPPVRGITRSPLVAAPSPFSERKVVGIVGGLSRETSSPANANEPHQPAAEVAGRQGSFHETACAGQMRL